MLLLAVKSQDPLQGVKELLQRLVLNVLLGLLFHPVKPLLIPMPLNW
jgi:hypothetical protein